MRTVLVCVRTPLAAQSIASCAARLGAGSIRTATNEAEVMARLTEQPAELILADTVVTRPDPVGFTRRVLARAPRALLLLFGNEEPQVATASVAAGARGLIRGADHDPVAAVVKALLLIGSPRRPTSAGGAEGPAGSTVGAAAGNAVARPPADPAGGERQLGRGGAARPGGGGAARNGTGGPGTPGRGGGGSGPAGGPAGAAAEGTPSGEPPPGGTPAGHGPADPSGDAARQPPTMVPVQRGDAVAEPAPVPGRRLALTERELQVLRGMADGKSNAEIGRDLYVSEDTVKTHARRLFRKLGVRDRAHAVAVGFRSGALG